MERVMTEILFYQEGGKALSRDAEGVTEGKSEAYGVPCCTARWACEGWGSLAAGASWGQTSGEPHLVHQNLGP